MRTRLYRPSENVYPETLVVAPYPFGGVPANTDVRLQETAIRAHVDILGVQAVGTGNRAFIDLCRGAVTPARFQKSCWQDSLGIRQNIKAYGQDYEQLIGWGDSARGLNVLRMQYDSNLFDRLLIRDGINLDFTGSRWSQARRYLDYSEKELPKNQTDVPPDSDQNLLGRLATIPGTVAEFYNYMELLAADEALQLAMRLATRGDLPMRMVGVSRSFSGTEEMAEGLANGVAALRTLSAYKSGLYCEMYADTIPGGHSELLRPGLAAQHIGETIAIETVMLMWEQGEGADG